MKPALPTSLVFCFFGHPAIVVIWYGSQQMGAALADALPGAVSLATRSPYTG